MEKNQKNNFWNFALFTRFNLFISVSVYCVAVLEVTHSVSVAGHRAFLPCDLSPPTPSELVYLVLWYRVR